MSTVMPMGRYLLATMCAATVIADASTSRAAAFMGYDGTNSPPPADILAKPDRYYSWDVGHNYTWKMDSDFVAYFPTSALQKQVQLAFDEWEEAMTSAVKRANPNYSWRRYNGFQPVHDLRTVINHEIGHVLGSQHTDASWFNSNFQSNFRFVNSQWVAAPPIGGELMNEGNDGNTLPNAKPDPGLLPGEVHRLVSRDEMDFLDYAYGGPITFTQVGAHDEADIVLTMHNINGPQGNNLGSAGVGGWEPRDENDDDAGRRITRGVLSINANPTTPIGISSRPSKWEFANNTGKDIIELALQTRGTDNRAASAINSAGPNRFTKLGADNVIIVPHLEDVIRRFSQPVGGVVPDGATVRVGFTLDTWDWTLVDVDARDSDGDVIWDVEVVTVFDWTNNGDPDPYIPFETDFDFITPDPRGLPSRTHELIARGFHVVNNATTTTVLSKLALAVVPEGLDPTAENLGADTMALLAASGALIDVPIAPITLAPEEDYVFVLDGERSDLPAELLTTGRFSLLDMPALAGEQLFIYVGSGSAADPDRVSNFSFLNNPPHVPEPLALALLGLGGLVGLQRRR